MSRNSAVESTSAVQITSIATQIYSGKQPNDLPELSLREYETGANTIRTAITGPQEGLTIVHRNKNHLSVFADIDFIDDKEEEVRHNPKRYPRRMSNVSRKSNISQQDTTSGLKPSDFKKSTDEENNETDLIADVTHWNAPSNDHSCGIAISLYEKNPITNIHAGDPIADCYGMIARRDSCVMAMADGVNWGEKVIFIINVLIIDIFISLLLYYSITMTSHHGVLFFFFNYYKFRILIAIIFSAKICAFSNLACG